MTRMSALTISIQQCTTGSSRAIMQEKEIKGIRIEKGEVNLSMFADDIILSIENLKNSQKKLFELIMSLAKLQHTRSTYNH